MNLEVKDDFYRIQRIKFFCDTIVEFLDSKTFLEFKNDYQLNFAIVFALGQIGEEMNKLSSEFKKKYPSIPWQDIISMRHRIVHDYEGVDLDIAWESANEGVPDLLAEINEILKQTD